MMVKVLLLVFAVNSVAFATDFKVKIEAKTSAGYYTCNNPKIDENKDKSWYQKKHKSWKCKLAATNVETEQDLRNNIGKVVIVEGSNIEESITTSRGGWSVMQIFAYRFIKAIN